MVSKEERDVYEIVKKYGPMEGYWLTIKMQKQVSPEEFIKRKKALDKLVKEGYIVIWKTQYGLSGKKLE